MRSKGIEEINKRKGFDKKYLDGMDQSAADEIFKIYEVDIPRAMSCFMRGGCMEKILLVDDDTMNSMATEMILGEMGYDVVTADNGEACLKLLKEDDFDLLILDINMQGMSGMEVLSLIRQDEDIKDIKTVFLTVSSQREDMTEAIRLGALDFITKPALPEKLISVVRQALKVKRREVILAVDDEMMNLMAIEDLLGIRYDLKTASSGYEALEILEGIKPDLVLLDLHMPGMDGLEVLEAIRVKKGCENLPVVFLTADSDNDTEADLFKAGAAEYIVKPFVIQVAMQRIRRVLELKLLQDSLQEEVDRKTEALLESNIKIQKLSDQVIAALAGAIDAKDGYTNGHSYRVAVYAKEIARRMGKNMYEQDEIYNIALLHDVGKIGIPNTLIQMPRRLTKEEYEVIKGHTIKGYEILKNISEMPSLSIGARWHHERYDGSGYPDGKAGEDIPEAARIICVADCYDAMSSDRSYRDALPQYLVRGEIERGKGRQFDPRIADIMLMMIDEDKDYRMRGGNNGK